MNKPFSKLTCKERKSIMQYIIHNNFKTMEQFATRFNVSIHCIRSVIDYYEKMYNRNFYQSKKQQK